MYEVQPGRGWAPLASGHADPGEGSCAPPRQPGVSRDWSAGLPAGIVSPEAQTDHSVELAVLADIGLTERQKQSLLDVYSSFLALNANETHDPS